MLKEAANEEEPDGKEDMEELYEKLFMKIGRDFLFKEDFYRITSALKRVVDPFDLAPIDDGGDIGARKKAVEYKLLLDSGKDGSKIYHDLINLDD